MNKLSTVVLLLYGGIVMGQSPGGITGVESWLKTTANDQNNLQGNYVWKDYSGDNIKLMSYGASTPFLSPGNTEYTQARTTGIRSFNFNPALYFAYNSNLKLLLTNSNLVQTTILGVYVPTINGTVTSLTGDTRILSINGRTDDGVLISKDLIYRGQDKDQLTSLDYGSKEGKDLIYKTTDVEADANKFRERSMRTLVYMKESMPNYDIWGERDKAALIFGNLSLTNNSSINSTYSTIPSTLVNGFNGYIPELIVYSRLLSPLERVKVESYLASKYGLTLDVSYIGSNGELLWDMSSNSTYNNRITSIGRDNVSNLMQRVSTTSYEEGTYYSDAYDSYEGSRSDLGKSSRYRLLVMGLEKGNPLSDTKYTFWGDNNQSVTINSVQEPIVSGIKVMPRRWLMKTNMKPTTSIEQNLTWNINDLDNVGNNFVSQVTKKSTSTNALGSMVTGVPINKETGYFSFVLGSTTLTTNIILKLGSQDPVPVAGGYDYGYKITGYSIYKIEKGNIGTTVIGTLPLNGKFELEKENNVLYVRINNSKVSGSEIIIPDADNNKSLYGSLSVSKSTTSNVILKDFTHGGFVDTGYELELSYDANRAASLAGYATNQQSYLIIDRSGAGDFQPQNVDYYVSTENDPARLKIIFNNVFWDKDGNGKDVFTFGYKSNSLIASIGKTNPTCSSLNAGQIQVEIKEGLKGFTYSLQNLTTNTTVGKGTTDTYQLPIFNNLSAGNYELKINEIGGSNFTKSVTSTIAKATANQSIISSGSLEARYIDATTDAYLGMSKTTSLTTASMYYGVHIKNGQLYIVSGGSEESSSIATLSLQDVIKIERTASAVNYLVNGIKMASRTNTDIIISYPYVVLNSKELTNVKGTGFIITPFTWNVDSGMQVSTAKPSSLTESITLTAPDCTVTPSNPTTVTSEFTTAHTSVPTEILASYKLQEASPVNILVYDMTGKLIQEVYIAEPLKTQTVNIKNIQQGAIYIVKAITNQGEFSSKIQM